MRERAAVVKGRLDVRGAPEAGTEIKLRVPGATAYRLSRQPRDGRGYLAPQRAWTRTEARRDRQRDDCSDLRADDEPTRTALAMAEAVHQHTNDLLSDDPGDNDRKTLLLLREAKRYADALRLVLRDLTRGAQ
jgi:hypothetical protein